MRKNAYIIPAVAIILGIAGFFFRKKELATIFDATTGLAQKNAPVSIIIFLLTIVAVLFFLAFSIFGLKSCKAENSYEKAFKMDNISVFALYIVACILMLAGGIYYCFEAAQDYYGMPILDLIFTILAMITAIAQIFVANGSFKGKGGNQLGMCSVAAAVFFSYWLITTYRLNATNPVTLDYYYECLAMAAAVLAFYFSSGFAFKKPRLKQTVFFSSVALFMCVMSLADMVKISQLMVLLAAVVMLAINLGAALKNTVKK